MTITLHKTMAVVAYCAYEIAPRHKPRNIEVVMEKVQAYLKEHLEQPLPFDKTFRLKEIAESDIKPFIHDMMFSIPEFLDWNLSEVEIENGVKVDDEGRDGFVFTSIYDARDENSWKTDFIDLNAFVQNAVYMIKRTQTD